MSYNYNYEIIQYEYLKNSPNRVTFQTNSITPKKATCLKRKIEPNCLMLN